MNKSTFFAAALGLSTAALTAGPNKPQDTTTIQPLLLGQLTVQTTVYQSHNKWIEVSIVSQSINRDAARRRGDVKIEDIQIVKELDTVLPPQWSRIKNQSAYQFASGSIVGEDLSLTINYEKLSP